MPKAISLYAPWAVAVALGEKKIETRSWSTDYRGEIYIHATKSTPIDVIRSICGNETLINTMKQYIVANKNMEYILNVNKGRVHIKSLRNLESALPHGKIIAKANLIDCKEIHHDNGYYALLDKGNFLICIQEYNLGDYTAGRYAWILENVVMLDNPIPAKGKQRIWTFDMEGVE